VHEAAIVRELIALAREKAPARSRVLEVEARVGRLTGVSPDAMAFYFEFMREDTLGPQARLSVRLMPLSARCAACSAACEVVDEGAWNCPACGRAALVFENGDELDLVGLVVEDETSSAR
jgi:hydrogenase nickel incorporation protein HypA/HybF